MSNPLVKAIIIISFFFFFFRIPSPVVEDRLYVTVIYQYILLYQSNKSNNFTHMTIMMHFSWLPGVYPLPDDSFS